MEPTTPLPDQPHSGKQTRLRKILQKLNSKKIHVAIFALLIGGIGTYMTFFIRAETIPTPIEAEKMTSSTSSTKPIYDSRASGTQTLQFLSNSSASISLPIDGKLNKLEIRARSLSCNGTYAKMTVKVDSTQVMSSDVKSTSYTTLSSSSLNIASGTHKITVAFVNDYYSRNRCDRNLYVDKIIIYSEKTTTPAPTPPPVTTDPNCTPAYGTYSAGAWPPACWRPYAASSPFNRGVPANPKVVANSAQIMARIKGFSPTINNLTAGTSQASDYAHPTFYPKSTDPTYTIHCVKYACDDLEGKQVKIPVEAKAPPTNNDGHLTIVDQTTNFEYDFYEFPATRSSSGGVLNVGSGGVTRMDSSGITLDLDNDGSFGGSTAAGFGNLAGMMRAQELQAQKINHALFMVISCNGNSSSGKNYVYPANHGGAQCSDPTNAPPMGSHMWLDMSEAEVNALSIPQWQKTMLHAYRTYGAFMGDTGGAGWSLMMESGLTYTSFGQPDPIVDWAKNSGWAPYNGTYVGKFNNIPSTVWERMRILDPCVSQGSC